MSTYAGARELVATTRGGLGDVQAFGSSWLANMAPKKNSAKAEEEERLRKQVEARLKAEAADEDRMLRRRGEYEEKLLREAVADDEECAAAERREDLLADRPLPPWLRISLTLSRATARPKS